MILELTRLETGPTETVGVLTLDKKIIGFILEPPKDSNKRGVSCIPTGQYLCQKYDSEKYGVPCLAIHDVSDRDHIAMHYGNTAKDTKGCLLIGAYVGSLEGKRAVLRSRDTLNSLMNKVNAICYLTVRENF